VPSTKNPSTRPASIAKAAQRTRSVIEDLQTRLAEVSQHGSVGRLAAAAATQKQEDAEFRDLESQETAEMQESEAELERQLAAYFARASGSKAGAGGRSGNSDILDELRRRVIDGVVERILEEWANDREGAPGRLREEVMERLVQRVLQQVETGSEEKSNTLPF
jgi:hypothetical protein